jgi:hypothetical protein
VLTYLESSSAESNLSRCIDALELKVGTIKLLMATLMKIHYASLYIREQQPPLLSHFLQLRVLHWIQQEIIAD